MKLALKILAWTVGSVVVLFLVILGYDLYRMRTYAAISDTHDLQVQVNRLAGDYVNSRPQVALVVAVTQHGQRYIEGAGIVSATQPVVPDGRTLFEIGSVTKVFTAVTLATLVGQGEVSLDDPISRFLPKDVASPRKNGREITLGHLATQTSGLPTLPPNFLATADPKNPYARYHLADLYRDLAAIQLVNEPGTTYLYSNFAFGLLGQLLALKTGRTYETLVQQNVCGPLGLGGTVFALTDVQQRLLAPGHDAGAAKGTVVPGWDQDAMAPAGALKSNADDLLVFLEANLRTSDTAISRALVLAREEHFKTFARKLGLAWQIQRSVEGQTIWWHNGGTGGYRSFIGFDPKTGIGVVVLSSYGDAMVNDGAVDKIGLELLRLGSKISLSPP